MDKTEPRFRHQQHILNCALAVVAVYTQFVVLLMATSAPTERADGMKQRQLHLWSTFGNIRQREEMAGASKMSHSGLLPRT
jgi:hypothetical protein